VTTHLAYALLALAALRPAQSAPSPFVGEWRGESVCLANRGVCHDEVVVYRIRPDTARRGALTLDAWKIVNGQEEAMGALACTADARAAVLTCPMPPQYRPGTWRFVRRGRSLDGRLTMADGTVFRRIHVVKADRATGAAR
jgi:hypothetical protein